ncbi:MAG: hypothetical protein AAF628_10125 [Planctomycetota bacterium]
MQPRYIAIISLCLAATSPALAQQQGIENVEFRVTQNRPGAIAVIDRGQRDGIEVGDLVHLYPRGGGMYRGSVSQVDERTAVVEFRDRRLVAAIGARGEVLVPRSRFAAPEPPPTQPGRPPAQPPAEAPVRAPVGEPGQPAEHPPWQNQDDDYRTGQPLLAQVRPVRPEERAMRLSGRAYFIADLTYKSFDEFSDTYSDTFFRIGTDFNLENPFGNGGILDFNTEVGYRTEVNEVAGFDALPRRLSYQWGGTRFAEDRWQVGRFLQSGMPELGILDGAEWTRRSPDGHRFGATLGFLPQLDDDFDSFKDFQAAGYYHWFADDSEQTGIGGAYQKSWHKGETDRDLILLKAHHLPATGWNAYSTVWVDYYYGPDQDSGFEVTQAIASVGRRFASGNGIDLTFRRLRFPEVQRQGFRPIPTEEPDVRYDRLGLSGWYFMTPKTRLSAHLSGYDDEDDQGGALETQVDVDDLVADGTRTSVTLFGNTSEFEAAAGGRVALASVQGSGAWDVFYELSNHHFVGFLDERDDLLLHRFGGGRSYYTDTGWSLSFRGESRVWDSDVSWTLGCHVQRSF